MVHIYLHITRLIIYSILWSPVVGQIRVAGQQKLCNGDRTINLELNFLVSLSVCALLYIAMQLAFALLSPFLWHSIYWSISILYKIMDSSGPWRENEKCCITSGS
jgi:hypothetical protein